jgi:hypothetical protein
MSFINIKATSLNSLHKLNPRVKPMLNLLTNHVPKTKPPPIINVQMVKMVVRKIKHHWLKSNPKLENHEIKSKPQEKLWLKPKNLQKECQQPYQLLPRLNLPLRPRLMPNPEKI